MSIKQNKKTGKWQASIRFYGKDYHTGTFDTQEEADKEYHRIKRISNRIKSQERAKKAGIYKRGYEIGQEIKKVCMNCCRGNVQKVYDCAMQECEYFNFKPTTKRKYNSLRRQKNDY